MAVTVDVADSIASFQRLQCGLCQGVCRRALATSCCNSTACTSCAAHHLQQTGSCWTCETEQSLAGLVESSQLRKQCEQGIADLLACHLCRDQCHRAVHLPCCPGCPVCRGCGIKHVTNVRSCWQCSRSGVLSAQFLADELVRGAITFQKENGGQHCKDTLGELLQRKIRCLQELAGGSKDQAGDTVIEEEEEHGEREDKSVVSNNDLRHKILVKEDRHKKKSKKERERDRDRHKNREREKDREWERGRKSDLRKHNEPKDSRTPSKRENQDNNGGAPAAVGSFAAMQRRIREEQEIVERLVAQRVEEQIAIMVADQLRQRQVEIQSEVLGKVALARQNMEAEVELEIAVMKKFQAAEQARRLAEMEAAMAERERRLEEEQRKLAEERLVILENQMKVEKEVQREKKREERRQKSEQMKILGKDKSRPKLSFTLVKN